MKKESLGRTHVMSAPPVLPARSEVCGSLTVLSGGSAGLVVSLTSRELLIGRSPETGLQLDDNGLSRCHARITRLEGAYILEDLGSTNGTYVDGRSIDDPVRLLNGMRVQMGGVVIEFNLQDRLQQEAAQRMYDMTVRDGLTGMYNRRHFDERFASEFAFAMRHQTPLGLIMVDIDHFKHVNDRYGHPAGDAVLKEVARALQGRVRVEDTVCRFGGEEFAVIVRGIAPAGVRALGERLRELVQSLEVELPTGKLRVTASFGVSHNVHPVSRGEQLIACADAALYEAKRRGRNRVEGPSPVGQYGHDTDSQRGLRARHQITRPVGQ